MRVPERSQLGKHLVVPLADGIETARVLSIRI